MSTAEELPIARLLYPISGEEKQEWEALLLLSRDRVTEAALLSDRLAAAGWQTTLHHGGTTLELVARKRQHTLCAAIDELRALGAAGAVYLDAPDEGSTISSANLAEPDVQHELDGPRPPATPDRTATAAPRTPVRRGH
jgi:hypothetical protein